MLVGRVSFRGGATRWLAWDHAVSFSTRVPQVYEEWVEAGLVLSRNIEPIRYHPEIPGHNVGNRQQFHLQCQRRITSTSKDNPIPIPSFSCAQIPVGDARSAFFAAVIWRLQQTERRYGSVSISLFLPRTCSLGNGTLTHPHHRHRLALILARRGTVPRHGFHTRRILHRWKVTDSTGVLARDSIVYLFMYVIFRSIGVAHGLTVSV